MLGSKTYKGTFRPKFPDKYRGNAKNIIFRSSWEKRLMGFLDSNPNVLEWASEEIIVPYVSPLDGKLHRYFPDFVVKLRGRDGVIRTVMIEVKPQVQIEPPKTPKRRTKRFLAEVATYSVNQAKWAAAREFCADRGWVFQLMNEHHLGL